MQSDPFHAECRAYGRLKEAGEEHLAAKAYGYVKLFVNERTEEMFKPAVELDPSSESLVFLLDHWNFDHGSNQVIRRPENEPIYGIVKEWVGDGASDRFRHDKQYRWNMSKEVAVEACHRRIENLPAELESLEGLHRNGIVVRDLHEGQWVEGKLVDLSCSWTFPHVLGQGDRHRPDWSFASYAARDLYDFQDMIDSRNRYLDGMDPRFPQEGILPSSKKSTLVAYPKPEAPARRVNREGLRPLPHRCEPQLRPLLQYDERYDPDSTEKGPNFVPWTHGPRFDPAKYVPPKEREEAARRSTKACLEHRRKPPRRGLGANKKTRTASKASNVVKKTRKVARKA